jgi:hypothetical protein
MVMLAVAALAVPAQASLYTFENLNLGADLVGQDNWTYLTGTTSPSNQAKVLVGTGFNTSKVASPFSGDMQLGRENNGSFSIPTFTGTEKIYYQADFQYGTQLNVMTLVKDTESPAYVVDSFAPWIGFSATGSGPTFAMNFNYRSFGTAPPPQLHIPVASVAPEIQTGDWVTLRLELDLPGNGGNGTASAFYKDLTLGQTSFTPIPGIQNLSGNLSGYAAPVRYSWDEMFIRGGISNGNNCFDNIEVNAIIPEPSSMLLIAIGAIGLAGCGRRNRRKS